MFTRTIQLIAPDACPTTASALYTVPAKTRTRITKMTATNTSGTARQITVYLVASGGTAGATNTVVSAYSVGPGQDVSLTSVMGHVLPAGATIQAIVNTGTDLVIAASGTEVTT